MQNKTKIKKMTKRTKKNEDENELNENVKDDKHKENATNDEQKQNDNEINQSGYKEKKNFERKLEGIEKDFSNQTNLVHKKNKI